MKMFIFLDQRKQAKMHWLQNPNQNKVDNLNNIRWEASRHFSNKKQIYFEAKLDELETNNKIKKSQGFVKGHK
jgi:hypothetical protein